MSSIEPRSFEPRSIVNRRSFLGLAGLAGAGALVAACGGPTTTAAPSTSAGSAAGSAAGGASGAAGGAAAGPNFSGVKPAQKITFWTNNPGSSQKVTQQIIDAFTAQTKISVELVTAGANYDDIAQKFQTAQAGGGVPDAIVLSDVWWFRYYLQQSIIPLNTAMDAVGIKPADYVDSFFNDYVYKGSQWAVPWARSTPLFYYNKTHWAKAGLPDRSPKTWDEFAEWAPKLAAAGTGAPHVFEFNAPKNTPGMGGPERAVGSGRRLVDEGDLRPDHRLRRHGGRHAVVAGHRLQGQVGDHGRHLRDQRLLGRRDQRHLGIHRRFDRHPEDREVPGRRRLHPRRLEGGDAGLPDGWGGDRHSGQGADREPAGGSAVHRLPDQRPERHHLRRRHRLPAGAQERRHLGAEEGESPVQASAGPARGHPLPGRARVLIPGADSAMTTAIQKILSQQADVKSTLTALQTQVQGFFDQQVKPHL